MDNTYCFTDDKGRSLIIYSSIKEILLKKTSETNTNFSSEELNSIVESIKPLIESKEAIHFYYSDNYNEESHIILGNLQICIDNYTLSFSNLLYTKHLVPSSLERTKNMFDNFLEYYNG